MTSLSNAAKSLSSRLRTHFQVGKSNCNLALVCIGVAFSAGSIAKVTPEWIRYAAISPDASTIAFTYQGDIYSVPAAGGQATRLTFHEAHDYAAVWSSDGSRIAFASNRFGNFDVYAMNAKGGEAQRLTYHSSDEEPYTFSNDDKNIMFKAQRMDTAEHRQHPTRRLPELYSVPGTGGKIEQVMTITAESVQLSADGNTLLYQDHKGTENQWRKHHRSSATRDVWRYDVNSGEHQQLTQFSGEDRNPVFSQNNDAMFYLSEQNGSFNVYRMAIDDPQDIEQVTNFDMHPVRFLSRGQNTLAFTHHGSLYTLDVSSDAQTASPQQVDVTIRTQDIGNNMEMLSVNGEITQMSISPNGKEIAFIAHGDVFVSDTEGNFTKQITETAAREASVSFSPDGDYLVYAAERGTKWSVFKAEKVREQEPFFYAASLIKESALIDNEKDNYQPKISPNGERIAYVEDRRTIKVMELDSKDSVDVVPGDLAIHFRDGDQEFSWSPDGEWILFEYRKLLQNTDVAIVSADGDEDKRMLIPSGYRDYRPKWVNNGKQVLYFSNSEGLKSYATSGRSQLDVFSVFLTQEDWDEFTMSEEDFELMQAIEDAQDENAEDDEQSTDDDKKDEVEVIEPIEIEWDGMDRRIARLTIHSSRLSDAVLNKDADTLYYLSEFEDGFDLWETNLRSKETKKLISLDASGGSLLWDDDMETLYLLSDGSIAKLDLEDASRENIGINAEILVDHDAVRKHAFDHVWLRTSKIFYEPSYHGVDWSLMQSEYAPKVSHVANVFEFTELLSEMLGELNVSHSGAGTGRFGSPDYGIKDETASLGIFYDHNYDGAGIKITEVIKDGPLDKAKYDVEAGSIIRKIDGQDISENMDWAKLLNRKAGKFVLLDIAKGERDKAVEQITVKPISRRDEGRLLYQRFVKINEQEVLERSDGKLGYVHIPNMADGPYRSIYDDMLGRFFDKEAMVVDARFNGGGDLVADLAMFFTGEPFLTYATEAKVVGGEPTSRYTKPIISLFNEAMYSDGHCYASGYVDLQLGKSVGMPVPGTCSFAGWEGLPLGGFWGVVPVSAKNKAGEWLENNQTSPQVIIKNMPEVIINGRDQQLERAIDEILEDL
ncbi:S41 family peptidase [Ningiella sp. W23]|uniref:S41 family peptidase n=1 Tax=Ningiella sp. W23 TaxID=3023715 RepID=UPI003757A370